MASPSFISKRLLAVALAGSALALCARAHADTLIINQPGDHPRYPFEAEPHLLLGLFGAPGVANGDGIGLGFRGTVVIVQNGFIPRLNNSIGIGFGLDWVHYGRGRDHCVPDQLSSGVCTYDDSESVNAIWLPVVMQWNFFLSRQWSVFGEPGISVRYESVPGDHFTNIDAQFYVGGRWHFSDHMTLTARVGYPTFSLGLSFM